ncbi:hypothetical protein BTI_3886 [Burkholderia thailandensis MSMB121]|nr:hypothetical protein BTI_3886 [Burkholderia thailandensis MSMB121]
MAGTPSSAPLRFFARLAPGARHAPGSVRAALPSRFAAAEAGAAGTFADDARTIPATRGDETRGHPTPTPFATRGAHAAGAGARSVAHVSPVVDAVAQTPQRETSFATAFARERTPHDPAASAAAPDIAHSGATDTLATSARSSAATRDAASAPFFAPLFAPLPGPLSGPLLTSRLSALRESPHRAPSRPSPPWPAAPVRAPLQAAAVAGRAASTRADAPSVVHVSIERIDVRMPAAPPAAPQPAPKPRATPAMPLGDYLRQRQRERARGGEGGGASS